jgi:hypothetical protein
MGTVLSGSTNGVYLLRDTKGRTYIKGVEETRKKMLAMGLERNLYEKWIKESSLLAAREATRTAPRLTGSLALSIRGFASKRWVQTSKTTRSLEKRFAFGGVVTAGSPARVPYSRQVSYGMRHVAGEFAKTNNFGSTRRIWRKTIQTPGNPYMVKAREAKKAEMVELLNRKMKYWIKQKGFETNGI